MNEQILFPYPIHKLTTEEISNPHMVLQDLFSFSHLPELREMLWKSLKANITGNYPKHLTNWERNEVVHLFEQLERLLEAAHLINECRKQSEDTGGIRQPDAHLLHLRLQFFSPMAKTDH